MRRVGRLALLLGLLGLLLLAWMPVSTPRALILVAVGLCAVLWALLVP